MMNTMSFADLFLQHRMLFSGAIPMFGRWEVKYSQLEVGKKSGSPAFSFKTSELNFEILKEEPGYRPAPYLASRGMKWIQRFESLGNDNNEIKKHLESSYRIVSLSLSKKKRKELGLS